MFKRVLPNKYAGSDFNYHLFKKIYIKNIMCTSILYQNDQKNESYFIKYLNENATYFGEVQFYLKVTTCSCKFFCQCPSNHIAIIRKFDTIEPFSTNLENGTLTKFHQIVNISNDFSVTEITDIEYVCFHINFSDGSRYLVEPVNILEDE